jgi:hypothetical protein
VCIDLPALLTAPRQARRFATATLERWHFSREVIETTRLIISELVTNSIKACESDKGKPQPGDPDVVECVSLALWRSPGHVVIEVSDRDSKPPVLGDADVYAERGRGLLLVRTLSERWGVRRRPSGGKVVYAVIPTRGTGCGE